MNDLFKYAEQYPHGPGHRKRETSAIAAQQVTHVQEIYKRILDNLTEPMTFYDMRDKLGLLYSRVQPRMSDLIAQGKIVDSGQRKKTPYGRSATLWEKAK